MKNFRPRFSPIEHLQQNRKDRPEKHRVYSLALARGVEIGLQVPISAAHFCLLAC